VPDTRVSVSEKYIAVVRNLRFRDLIGRNGRFLLGERGETFSIAGSTIPRVLPVEHIGSCANRIESNPDGIDQKAVL
jgi:hypothetical protein